MIIEYDILTKDTPDDLAIVVDEAIAGGWQPFGGVSVSLSESDDYQYIVFAQAIVRYADREQEPEQN